MVLRVEVDLVDFMSANITVLLSSFSIFSTGTHSIDVLSVLSLFSSWATCARLFEIEWTGNAGLDLTVGKAASPPVAAGWR